MTELLTPSIGTTGVYTLAEPFNTLLLPGVQYTCQAVRTIADLTASGIDPQSTYYTPVGLTPAQYQTDVANGVLIVSLQSATGTMAYVPNTYVTAFPAAGGVPYTVIALAMSLSAIPNALDLTAIKQLIVDAIQDTVGVPGVVVQEVQLSPTTLVDAGTAARMEAARKLNITNSTTLTAKNLALSNQLLTAQTQIGILQAYITANMTPAPSPTPSPTPSPSPS